MSGLHVHESFKLTIVVVKDGIRCQCDSRRVIVALYVLSSPLTNQWSPVVRLSPTGTGSRLVL